MSSANNDGVNSFMEISSESNRDLALYYLEIADQDLQKALNLYYQDKLEITNNQNLLNAEANKTKVQMRKSLDIVQWNIQGLLDDCLKERTVAIVKDIKRVSPDVVMLQEVVPITLHYIKSSCQEYRLFSPIDLVPSTYFSALMIKTETFQVKMHKIIQFDNSKQGRNMIVVSGTCHGQNITVMTSHLESLKSESKTRMEQVEEVWRMMVDQDPSHTVVFGGDTNLRVAEVRELCHKKIELANKMDDVWEALGSPEDSRYTWDCSKNNNQFQGSPARSRYDRLFTRHEDSNNNTHYRPLSMELIGTDRLPCGLFPSDHWGLFVRMSSDPVFGT